MRCNIITEKSNDIPMQLIDFIKILSYEDQITPYKHTVIKWEKNGDYLSVI